MLLQSSHPLDEESAGVEVVEWHLRLQEIRSMPKGKSKVKGQYRFPTLRRGDWDTFSLMS